MRAVAVDRFGGEPRVVDLPVPVAGPGEVLVRVAAAGVNPYDAKVGDGILEGRPHVFPLVLGVDGAGTVEACGPGVTRFVRGDPIFGQFLHDPVGGGTYAEYALVPERLGVTKVPRELSLVEAAALPTSGMTALAALDALDLRPGDSLAIVGASGGIGSIAIPLAAGRRASVVAFARPASAARLRALGAAETIDSAPDGLPGRLRQRFPRGVDALLDLMSAPPRFAELSSSVRPGGIAASTVFAADPPGAGPGGVRRINLSMQPSAALLDRLVEEVVSRRIPVPLERTVSLDGAVEALREVKSGRGVGKTVIVL